MTGKWEADFDTRIGLQKYLFTFHVAGETLTGKATVQVGERRREVELKEGKISGDTLSFVELLNFGGNELRITYTGRVGMDNIAFTRQVGDIAREVAQAKRVKTTAGTDTPPSASPSSSSNEVIPDSKRRIFFR